VSTVRVAAAAAHFGRDLGAAMQRIEAIVRHARRAGVKLVVLPHATLGGYLADLNDPGPAELPPTFGPADPVFDSLRALAGDLVVCVGFTEAVGRDRYNSAVCLTGDGILGRHRKVHQQPGEAVWYSAGDEFNAFDTPLGRVGMLIDYDKTFPEAARSLALDGASIIACLSAWPASMTQRASQLTSDRQTRLFDLYDIARAAENQLFLVSANQTGGMGELRFLGHAKVVDPSGQQLARTGPKAGLATAEIDIDGEIGRARRTLHHLEERRVDAYRLAARPLTPVATRASSASSHTLTAATGRVLGKSR
jgi:predicted amidohydrolase